ncbi:MAG: WD40 repeat domain-containing protein [Chitinophagales bacterium]
MKFTMLHFWLGVAIYSLCPLYSLSAQIQPTTPCLLDSIQLLKEETKKLKRQKEAAERSFYEIKKRELIALKQIEAEKEQRILLEKQKNESDSLRILVVSQQKKTKKRYLKSQIELLIQEGDLTKAFRLAEHTQQNTPSLESRLLLNEVYFHQPFQIDSNFYAQPFYHPFALEKFNLDIQNAQYSPDQTQLLITFKNNSSAMISHQQNKQQIFIEGHTAPIVAAKYSPNGAYIFTASMDKSIKVWNQKGQLLRTFNEPVNEVQDLQLSNNGRYVLTAEFGQAKIWDTNGNSLATLPVENQKIERICWSNQQEFILLQYKRTIEVWRKKKNKLEYKHLFSQTFNTSFNSLQFSANDQHILAAANDGTARIWQINGKELLNIAALKAHQSAVNTAYFSPNEHFILTASDDHTAKVWQWNESTSTASIIDHLVFQEQGSAIQSAHFSGDKKQIMTVSSTGKVKFWDWLAKSIPYFKGKFSNIASSPTKYVFASTTEQEIQVRNFQNKLQSTWNHQQGNIHTLQFSVNGKFLLSTSTDSTLKVWDWQKQELLDSLKLGNAQVFAAFSPKDSEVIATGTEEGFVHFYNWKTQTTIAELKAHTASINSLHFSEDGKYLTSSADDKMAIVWNTQTAEKVLLLQGHSSPVLHARFSEDGEYLVTASKDKEAKIWQINNDDIVRLEYKGHTSELLDAQFMGEDSHILTTSKDGSAKIWTKEGELLKTFQFEESITAAMPSYDLQYLLFFTTEGFHIESLKEEKLIEKVNDLGAPVMSKKEQEWYGIE